MLKKKYRIEKNTEAEYIINIDELKKIEIDILKTFVDFCNEHNLKYFLAGGTLIGAVRHQGFIPWDDDLDVSMPRPDFEKFRELTSEGKLGKYEIRSTIHTPELHARPFDRIVNPEYMTRVKVDQMFIPPWLDVHALDGLPTDEVENAKHWNAARKYKACSRWARTPFCLEKKRILRWIKRACLWPFKLIGPVYFSDRLTELGKQYNFNDSEYIAAYVAGYGKKERMPKYYFMDGEKKMWFEGILCSVPPHYDLVLGHMYGNFMQLPAPKKRVKHVLKAWKVKK